MMQPLANLLMDIPPFLPGCPEALTDITEYKAGTEIVKGLK
jgi:hypothetical protein